MELGLVQQQQQTAVQQQRLAAYQLLQVKLLEMPLAQLEETVRAELDDNPALETASNDTNTEDNSIEISADNNSDADDFDEEDAASNFEKEAERQERADEIDSAFDSIGRDDRMPDFGMANTTAYAADYEEMVFGNTTSFYDNLREQMGEISLNEEQRNIMEYLIGSLDDDGLLRKDAISISDELAIYHNLDVDEKQVDDMIAVLQSFDPPGIGARSLQECLLIQLERKISDLRAKHEEKSDIYATLTALKTIISRYFPLFKQNQWQRIARSMHLDEEQLRNILRDVKRLNPRPGASLGEAIGRSLQQITPDFIVESDDSGYISVSLNKGNLPSLVVSPSFSEMVKEYQSQKQKMTKSEREAYKYAIDRVDSAQVFIDAVRLRRTNMLTAMQTIVALQHDYFISGDESDLKPMVLKDVAEHCNLNISTISRVTNLKYIQTRWGIIPMRMLFRERHIATADGKNLSTTKIQQLMKDIIDSEDKHHPIGDEALREILVKHGYPIARRTIAKYREKMGIPVARLRKDFSKPNE